MKFLDAQGRLFGKISILDLGAAAIILLTIVGIFFFPGTSGAPASVGGSGGTKPIEIDVLVQGLRVSAPARLQQSLQESETTEIIIRNQPFGKVDLLAAEYFPRTVEVPQPDGSVEARPDPRPGEQFTSDWKIVLGGKAQLTSSGPVLGNSKVKIGTPIELEGFDYNFRGSIIDLRLPE